MCRPLDLGTHAAFVIGSVATPGGCAPNGTCPPPPPVTVIFRRVSIRSQSDVLVTGVVTASNSTRRHILLGLLSIMDRGKHQEQASVHGFAQGGDVSVPARTSRTVPYQFVFAAVSAGQHQFEVDATGGSGLRVGSASLVIYPLAG